MAMDLQAQKFLEQYEKAYPFLIDMRTAVLDVAALLGASFAAGGKLLICGNGGSNADAEHIVGELCKSFLCKRPIEDDLRSRLEAMGDDGAALAAGLQGTLPAINLAAHTSLATAIANDTDASLCFAQPLLAYGKPGDVLLAISTSGNSRNVVLAATLARAMNVSVIGLTGQNGGQLRSLCNVLLAVPEQNVLFIQEKHHVVYHLLCALVEIERWASREGESR